MLKIMGIYDRIIAHIAIWILVRLYGGECNRPTVPGCPYCDAVQMIEHLRLYGAKTPTKGT